MEEKMEASKMIKIGNTHHKELHETLADFFKRIYGLKAQEEISSGMVVIVTFGRRGETAELFVWDGKE